MNIYCSKGDGRIAVCRILEDIIWGNRRRKEIRSACWANLITTKNKALEEKNSVYGGLITIRKVQLGSPWKWYFSTWITRIYDSEIYFTLYIAVWSGSKFNVWFNDDPFRKLKASNTLGAYNIECLLKQSGLLDRTKLPLVSTETLKALGIYL